MNEFSQIYDDELEIPTNKQEPLLVLPQKEDKKVELEQDASVNKVAVSESKGKMMPTEVCRNGATFNNCSFVFNM